MSEIQQHAETYTVVNDKSQGVVKFWGRMKMLEKLDKSVTKYL